MSKPSPRKPIGTSLNDLISSSLFQGLAALVGLIAAVASDKLYIRIPALLVLLWGVIALRSNIWHFMKGSATWLTWKFALGLVVGVFISVMLFPFIEVFSNLGVSFFVHQVEVIETSPEDGKTLQSVYDNIEINFSERILSTYRSSLYVRAEITPYIPIRLVWLFDFNPSDCCRTLSIRPARYVRNDPNPQFDPNTTYHLRIVGLLIRKPLEIEFRTPPK